VSYIRFALVALLLASMQGCGNKEGFADLRAFVNAERAKPGPRIEPVPTFSPYAPFTYNAMMLRSPFQPPIRLEDIAGRAKGSKDVKPDENRVRQFLEGFSIDSFQMVGTLSNTSGLYALLSTPEGVQRVTIGDYLGLNHGRIVRIDADKMEVVEIISDGQGGWLERMRSLMLKETAS